MSYIRSALLIGKNDSVDFHGAMMPDAIVFDMSSPIDEPSVSATLENKIDQSKGDVVSSYHVRFSIGTSDDLRVKLYPIFSENIDAVWISGISETQQVRDADVEIRRLEMEHGIKPGTISLIPELNSVGTISELDGMLTAVDRVAAIALDLDSVYADLVVTNSGSSDDEFVQRHILAEVAMKVASQNLLLVVTNLDTHLSGEKIKMIASTGGTGILTQDRDSVASLNHEFTLSSEVIDRAQTVVDQWSNNATRAQEGGVTLQAFMRATHIVGLANRVDAG